MDGYYNPKRDFEESIIKDSMTQIHKFILEEKAKSFQQGLEMGLRFVERRNS